MVEIEAAGPAARAPGALASGLAGEIIPVPFGPTSAGQVLLSVACLLRGWSIRESTGLAGAVIELISGSSSGGERLATIALTAGFDPSAAQTPAASTQSGANTALAASITAGAGLLAFLTSLRITGDGATAGSTVTATLTGVLGGTISYPIAVPAGISTPITPFMDSFGTRGIPSAATGGTITLNLPAFGAGNTLALAEVSGYIQQTAGAERTEGLPDGGLQARNGVFVNVVSGSVVGAIWVSD